MKNIALIGSTGSIGRQVINVVNRNKDKFNIISMSAGENKELFLEQVKEISPKIATAVLDCNEDVKNIKGTTFFFGENAFTNAIIDEADIVVISLVGYKGILAVLDAIKKGKNIALANKESLVVGGELVTRLAKEKGISIVPIDSEHSAIWQALNYDFDKPFSKIILTASGGAFRDYSVSEIVSSKASEALKHPNWQMGNKITIDSATMVNKAFEVIEAKWLYKTTFDKIDVIIHRESIIHSMVEFCDTSTIAQMSYPNMELPIQIALLYPNRYNSGMKSLNFAEIGKLTFEKLNNNKYPCFELVVSAGKKGGCYPAVANGANDMAVKLYLQDKISYLDIYRAISTCLDKYNGEYDGTFACLENANDFALRTVKELFGE